MEITINVSDGKFKDIIQNELEAFDKEEIKSLIREGLIKCISDSKTFEGLFVRDRSYYSSSSNKVATDILCDAAKTINLSPAFDEFEEKARKWLIDNHSDVLKEIVTDIFWQGLSNRLFSTSFVDEVKSRIMYCISNHESNS